VTGTRLGFGAEVGVTSGVFEDVGFSEIGSLDGAGDGEDNDSGAEDCGGAGVVGKSEVCILLSWGGSSLEDDGPGSGVETGPGVVDGPGVEDGPGSVVGGPGVDVGVEEPQTSDGQSWYGQ
jgi:hypothetical protein